MFSVFFAIVAIAQSSQQAYPKPFYSAEGNYSVILLGPPYYREFNVNNVYGNVTYGTLISQLDRSGYHVVFHDHPVDLDPGKFLTKHFELIVSQELGNTVISKEHGSWQGFPSYSGDFYRRGPGYRPDNTYRDRRDVPPIAKVKLILVGRRLYQLMLITTDVGKSNELATRFFDSFRIGKTNR